MKIIIKLFLLIGVLILFWLIIYTLCPFLIKITTFILIILFIYSLIYIKN
jgi:hypothetical protein